tara:strand:+ start:142 stop:330 length:189 start_codon:yes stop_codon:yes gene_type:complete
MGMDCYSLDKEIKQLKSDVMQEIGKMKLMFAELYGYLSKLESEKIAKVKKGKKNAKRTVQTN